MKNRWLFMPLLSLLCLFIFSPAYGIDCVFKNPIIPFGQDPSVIFHDGSYYLVQSGASGLTIARSETLTGLGAADPVRVYAPPAGQPFSYDLWAPELFYHDGQWYIYIAATSVPGGNATHRMYVLQADTADPQGTWTMKGKVYDPAADKWAIDGMVFEYNDQLYMVWSGWPGDEGDIPQNLYIATMSDPLTLSSERHLLSEPDQPWETSVRAFQEGPEAFIHDGQLSIVYSANASWTTAYQLGMLVLKGDNPLDAAAWEKVGPVFSGYTSDSGNVYGVGHNSTPVTSPDGSESWLVYHTKTKAADGWDDRAIAVQKFTWNADGTPNFGKPLPLSSAQQLPAGEPCGLVAETDDLLTGEPQLIAQGEVNLENDFVDAGTAWVNTLSSYTIVAEVSLPGTGTPAALISQDGGISSNFALEYTGTAFAFTLFDPFGRSPFSAVSTLQPEASQWYHLIAVRNISTGAFRLYVDGQLQAEATFSDDWDAKGSTIIGGARKGSKRVNLLTGSVRDVQIYNGALSEAEIASLFETSGD